MKRRYARRRRVGRKRVVRRRRMMRRRRSNNKYDGGTAIKCHVFTDIKYYPTYSSANVTINWGSTSATPNDNLRITQFTEYQNFATLYKEYKLIGLKIRFVPISQVTSSLGSYLQEGWYASQVTQMLSETTPPNTILASDFYQCFDPSKGFKRYINCAKYYKSIDQEWQSVGAAYNDACSLIRLFGTGYNAGNVMGRVHATYYIKLRGTEI